jgi:hypothetical protein
MCSVAVMLRVSVPAVTSSILFSISTVWTVLYHPYSAYMNTNVTSFPQVPINTRECISAWDLVTRKCILMKLVLQPSSLYTWHYAHIICLQKCIFTDDACYRTSIGPIQQWNHMILSNVMTHLLKKSDTSQNCNILQELKKKIGRHHSFNIT